MVFWQDQSVARHRWGPGGLGGWLEGRFLEGWQWGIVPLRFSLLEFFVGLAASLYFLAMFTRFLPLMKEENLRRDVAPLPIVLGQGRGGF